MKIPTLPFTVTDWSKADATTHPGETGSAFWRTLDIGDVRVRMVEYTAGYLADHWCVGSEANVKSTPLGVRLRRCGTSLVDQDRREAFYRQLRKRREKP